MATIQLSTFSKAETMLETSLGYDAKQVFEKENKKQNDRVITNKQQ